MAIFAVAEAFFYRSLETLGTILGPEQKLCHGCTASQLVNRISRGPLAFTTL